jgi:hypothetical protein
VNYLIFIFFGKNEVDNVIKCGGMCGTLTNKAYMYNYFINFYVSKHSQQIPFKGAYSLCVKNMFKK